MDIASSRRSNAPIIIEIRRERYRCAPGLDLLLRAVPHCHTPSFPGLAPRHPNASLPCLPRFLPSFLRKQESSPSNRRDSGTPLCIITSTAPQPQPLAHRNQFQNFMQIFAHLSVLLYRIIRFKQRYFIDYLHSL